ncbi:MAG: NAD(P)/FAD-dependent oxidoreductase [Gemmatimonadetes bacterium]|nr:NAD(P)/FAD-dependent oxidoreductase [Gemmatimonadota bacterium]
MARVLVLGGGFGGVSAATELSRALGDDHEVILVDRSSHFVMGLRKLWALVGLGRLEDGSRDLSLLRGQGIRFEPREILSIDPAGRGVTTDRGDLAANYLVVALGAEPRPDLVPGLAEHGHNVWAAAGVPALKADLEAFDGGSIVIAIAGMPYTCPPAPFECAMLLDDFLRERGIRGRASITVTTPKPILLPNAGVAGSEWLAEQLAARGISYETGLEVKSVEEGTIDYGDDRLDFDLLIGVPPHRPPPVVAESALAGPRGWVSVDPGTFETSHAGVFAIGDVTKVSLANGLPLPKAGVMADLEGQRVAAAIAARVLGLEPPGLFDGRGFCFLEMSKSTAALIEGSFYARPEPRVVIAGESEDHAGRKHRFEQERLERWFGG